MNRKIILKTAATFLLATVTVLSSTAADYSKQINSTLPKVQVLTQDTFSVNGDDITDKTLTFIPASDPNFYYTSRVDFSDPDYPKLIWEGTEIRFTFTGTRLGLRFKDSRSAASWYNVTIDGETALLQMETAGEFDYFISRKLKKGEHTCTVFKRNEAGMIDTFCGIDVDAKGYKKATGELGPKPEPLPRMIEFYGDSITAGVCTETVGDDSYEAELMVTHNAYTAYPAITARNLGWELSDLAVGGTGISVSWNDFIMSRCWKNLYATPSSRPYDFSGRTPDVVVVNLGQNDYGYPASKGEKFPEDFGEKYFGFLKALREQYPDAWIICATGGMSAIKDSKQLQNGIAESVEKMNDPKLLSFTFKAFNYSHPRVDVHYKMALQLQKFIEDNVTFE